MAEYGKQLQDIIQKKLKGIIPQMVEQSATVKNKSFAVMQEIKNIIEEEKTIAAASDTKKSSKGKRNIFKTLRSFANNVKDISKTNDSVTTVLNSKSKIVQSAQALRLLLMISYSDKNNAQAKVSGKLLSGKNLNRIKKSWDNAQ